MKKILTILGIVAISIGGGRASVLLDADFNAYTSGNLVGQVGWAQTGTTTASPIQVSGGEVSLAQGTNQDANHSLSSSVTSGSIFYTATINISAKNATGDYALHLGDGGTSNFGARLYAQSSGTGFHLAWGGSSTAPTTYGADLVFNTNYTIVFQYNIVAGLTNDTGALYVTAGSFDSVQANNTAYQAVTTWTGGTEVTSFAAMYLRQGTNTGSLKVDNIVVGTSWADVVPEPATWAMIGLGSMMVLWRMRRKAVA